MQSSGNTWSGRGLRRDRGGCPSSRCFGSELLSRLVCRGISRTSTPLWFDNALMTALPSADIMSATGTKCRLKD